jgi:hypothetical protein
VTEILKGLSPHTEQPWDERVEQRREGPDRREIRMFTKIADNKITAGLVIALVLWLSAKVSGISELPGTVAQHETRITNAELEARTLRETQIRSEEKFSYIVKALERLEKREERRR